MFVCYFFICCSICDYSSITCTIFLSSLLLQSSLKLQDDVNTRSMTVLEDYAARYEKFVQDFKCTYNIQFWLITCADVFIITFVSIYGKFYYIFAEFMWHFVPRQIHQRKSIFGPSRSCTICFFNLIPLRSQRMWSSFYWLNVLSAASMEVVSLLARVARTEQECLSH